MHNNAQCTIRHNFLRRSPARSAQKLTKIHKSSRQRAGDRPCTRNTRSNASNRTIWNKLYLELYYRHKLGVGTAVVNYWIELRLMECWMPFA